MYKEEICIGASGRWWWWGGGGRGGGDNYPTFLFTIKADLDLMYGHIVIKKGAFSNCLVPKFRNAAVMLSLCHFCLFFTKH